MDEHQTRAVSGLVAAIEAFWGEPMKQGPVKSSITRCATNRGEAEAPSLLNHERKEFDELGRLLERLRYDDEGKLYRRERVAYPVDGRLIRFLVEPFDGGAPFEWRYLPDGPRVWASRLDADGNEEAIWSYALDAAGRIVECVQEDGRGRFLARHEASYDRAGRLLELVSLDADGPELRHRFEYGPGYRKISWDGGAAGSLMRLERYLEADRSGNWLCMSESTYRDGLEVGDATRYEREVEYYG